VPLFRITLFTCVHANEAVHRLKSSGRNLHWLLRELPERDERTKKEKRIKNDFEHTAAFFFRAHQKGVGGFLLVGHNLLGGREFIGSYLELVLVSLGAEVVSLALIDGLGSGRRINIHPAHRTEWVLGR
jgi:hypothetical protein